MKCSSCQTVFTCQSATTCWCVQYPPILSLEVTSDCLCPDCLQQKMQRATERYAAEFMAGKRSNEAPQYATKPSAVQEGIDYYMENGFFVFKAWHHLKRGTCCGSGCRHCPFAHANV